MKHKTQSSQASLAPAPLDRMVPFLLPLLLFFSITGTSRLAAALLAGAFLLLAIGRTPMAHLRQRLTPLTLAIFVYTLVCLASGLWSHFGLYAARESAKTLAAFSVFGIVLLRVKRPQLRTLLNALNGALAVIALLCIDGSSLQLLCRGFSKLMALFSAGYPLDTIGYETGVRITGIFSNANVSAGLLAFGLILSLYLLRTASSKRESLLLSLALGTQSLAFFLSFSMGAMAAFAVTCLVYLLCSAKGTRISLLLLMLECVVVTVLASFAAVPFLGGSGITSALPLLLGPVCGLLIWAADRLVGQRLPARLVGREKAMTAITAVLVVFVVGYGVLAYQLTGSATLNAVDSISRAVYPQPGAYTVTYEGVDAQVTVYSQTEPELMMHTNTPLYEGPLSGASFTVPEGSRVVWFTFSGDGELSHAALSDGTKIPLDYPLLPSFAANRLQGLWANQNFIQRLVFFRDGLKLFAESPLVGWGVGGVEGQLTAVQDFYYESKYIHNQFIQIMDEAGILGLAAFIALLGSALWMLLRRRKSDKDPLLAMFAACFTMMIAHSLTEVVWSTQVYQSAVFVLFAALIIYDTPEPAASSKAAPAAMAAAWCLTAVFAGLLSGHLLAARQMRNLDTAGMDVSAFMSAMQHMGRLDVYDDTDYKVNLMGNAIQQDTAIAQGIAAKCARELLTTQEYDACYNAAAYYYLPMRDLPRFFESIQTGLAQERSNPDAWNSAFHLFRSAFDSLEGDDMEDFLAGVRSTGAQLDAANAVLMAPITLDEGNAALLGAVRALDGVSGEAAKTVLASALQ